MEKVNEFIYGVLNELNRVEYQVLVYQNHNKRVQQIIECRSLESRLETITKQLQSVIETLNELQEYDGKAAIGNQILNQTQKAQKGIQYLEKFYKLDQNPVNALNLNMEDETITGYFNKLHLIGDDQSRQKVQKEIEKLQSMDKH